MAKHMIYPTAYPAEGGQHERRVEIQWFRDQDVRIGVTKLAEGADPTRVYISGLEVPPDLREQAWEGQFVDLDRTQINHLIRQLRIARDQAYGKDE